MLTSSIISQFSPILLLLNPPSSCSIYACYHLGILQGLHCASVSWILVFLRHHVYLFFLYIFIWGEHILQQLSQVGGETWDLLPSHTWLVIWPGPWFWAEMTALLTFEALVLCLLACSITIAKFNSVWAPCSFCWPVYLFHRLECLLFNPCCEVSPNPPLISLFSLKCPRATSSKSFFFTQQVLP